MKWSALRSLTLHNFRVEDLTAVARSAPRLMEVHLEGRAYKRQNRTTDSLSLSSESLRGVFIEELVGVNDIMIERKEKPDIVVVKGGKSIGVKFNN